MNILINTALAATQNTVLIDTAFGWSEVAKIGGVACVALLGLIGVLLGILLKRQTGFTDVFNNDVKTIKESLATETVDRKKDASDTKNDITRLHERIDSVEKTIMEGLRETCQIKQTACSNLMHTELGFHEQKTKKACQAIERIKQDQEDKWQKQNEFNSNVLLQVNNHNNKGGGS